MIVLNQSAAPPFFWKKRENKYLRGKINGMNHRKKIWWNELGSVECRTVSGLIETNRVFFTVFITTCLILWLVSFVVSCWLFSFLVIQFRSIVNLHLIAMLRSYKKSVTFAMFFFSLLAQLRLFHPFDCDAERNVNAVHRSMWLFDTCHFDVIGIIRFSHGQTPRWIFPLSESWT